MKRLMTYFALGAAVLFAASARLSAQQVDVQLSDSTTQVGTPVQLDIQVQGGQVRAPQLRVEGLDITQPMRSMSSQMTYNNGQFSASMVTVYSYIITPLREGDFTIPALQLSSDGKLKTPPQSLRVTSPTGGSSSMPVRPALPAPQTRQPRAVPQQPQQMPPTQQSDVANQPAFGSIVIPKKTAYVGEVIPVELRFYVEDNLQIEAPVPPRFSGTGFTVLKTAPPVVRQQEVNGRLYNVVAYQTAIIPAKTGTLDIGEAVLDVQVQVPVQMPGGMADMFSGFFGQPMQVQPGVVKTKPESIEVKALPKEDRPESFSGAIGQFGVEAVASPKKTAAGDPVTIDVVIDGRGNFDVIGAPALEDNDGWRTYPPKEKFAASDTIGYTGRKSFQYTVMARTDQTKTPEVEFSYFNPDLGKYVTIKQGPFVVDAKGSSAVGAPAASVAAAAPAPQPEAAQPTPAQAETTDALARTFTPARFTSLFHQREFLIANGALAVVWGLALIFALGRIAAGSSYAQKSNLRREARQILRQMEDDGRTPEDFFRRAEEYVSLQLAGTVTADPHAALERSSLPEEKKDSLRAILGRGEELKYSPGSAGSIDAAERKRVLDILKSLS